MLYEVITLVADDQLAVLDPDGAGLQVLGQRQRAAHHHRLVSVMFIYAGIGFSSLRTDRRGDNIDQGMLMGLDPLWEKVEFHRYRNNFV